MESNTQPDDSQPVTGASAPAGPASKKSASKKALAKARKGKAVATNNDPDTENPDDAANHSDDDDDGAGAPAPQARALAKGELTPHPNQKLTRTVQWMHLKDQTVATPPQIAMLYNLMAIARLLQLIITLLYQILGHLEATPSRRNSMASSRRSSIGAASSAGADEAGPSATTTDENVQAATTSLKKGNAFWDAIHERFVAHVTTGGSKDYVSRTSRASRVAGDFFEGVKAELESAEDGSLESSLLETLNILNLDLYLTQYINHSKQFRQDKKAAAAGSDAQQPENDDAGTSGSRRSARQIVRNASKSSGAEPSESQTERERREAQELRFAADEEELFVDDDQNEEAMGEGEDEDEAEDEN